MTTRPLLLRMVPPSLRMRLYYRLYRRHAADAGALFDAAPLAFAPGMRMRLMHGDEGHACIAFTGVYELDLTRRVVAAAREGGWLVDVGANYGYYSILWSAHHPANRVLGFEASPRNLGALRENLESNRLASRVEVRPIALAAQPGTAAFALGPDDQSGWGGLTDNRDAGSTSVTVQVETLDRMWSAPEDIAVLKVDVEGADTWVLQGASELLRRRRIGVVFYEQNKPRMRSLGIGEHEAEEFLRGVGYHVRAMSDPSRGLVEYCALPQE